MATKYRALRGLNYPDGKGGEIRVEPGEVVDIPAKYVRGYLQFDPPPIEAVEVEEPVTPAGGE